MGDCLDYSRRSWKASMWALPLTGAVYLCIGARFNSWCEAVRQSFAANQLKWASEQVSTSWWAVSLLSGRGKELISCQACFHLLHQRLVPMVVCASWRRVALFWHISVGPCMQNRKSVKAEATHLLGLPGSNILVVWSLVPQQLTTSPQGVASTYFSVVQLGEKLRNIFLPQWLPNIQH